MASKYYVMVEDTIDIAKEFHFVTFLENVTEENKDAAFKAFIMDYVKCSENELKNYEPGLSCYCHDDANYSFVLRERRADDVWVYKEAK